MAPITRSSVHGRSTTKRQSTATGSMDTDSDPEDMGDDHSFDEESPLQSAQAMLLPLQETANRVSRQVEEFAKCLDQFNSDRQVSNQTLWEDAWELLDKYSDLAQQRKEHTEDSQPTRQVVKNRSLSDNDRQIATLQLEADLWILTRQILVCKSPALLAQIREDQEVALGRLHRYSTDVQIWSTFLDSDEYAREYESMLDWLQQRAAITQPAIEKVLSTLTEKSERGDGIWSAGLIYTKDAIKKQKRSRAWPLTLDAAAPGLRDNHTRSTDHKPLVAQMDPDAMMREDATLAPQDEFHESAAWQTCWELLRRGHSIDEVREWWSDRKESWRSAVLSNANSQLDQDQHTPWLRIINIASNPEWLSRCHQYCERDLGTTSYENAVFGILSGDHMSSLKACRGMDDNLHSFFNAKLIERYKEYLVAYRTKLQNPSKIRFRPSEASYLDLSGFFDSSQADSKIQEELRQPNKFIESALLTQRLDDFFLMTGRSAAQTAQTTGHCANLIKNDDKTPTNDFAKIAAQSQDSVRIIAHLQLLLRSLGFLEETYDKYEYILENNIVNYIGYLEKERKFTLLPLYASKLSASRITFTLGTILIKIVDARERDIQIKLMKQYGIDVPKVLYGIFQLKNYHSIEGLKRIIDARHTKKITSTTTNGGIQSTKINSHFIEDHLSEEEQKQIQSVEWMKYMDKENWAMAAWAVSTLYKIFLLNGKLAGARELTQAANLAGISLSATSMNLSLAAVLEGGSENGDVDMAGSDELLEHVQPVSPSKKRRDHTKSTTTNLKETSSREELASQSRVWAQLEQLTDALSALERWQDISDQVESFRKNISQMRQVKKELQHALHDLQSAMLPLLDRDFLTLASDEVEERLLAIIRNHYIPECILGYNCALFFAGHALTRRYLIECMNLAQEVARNETLTDAFLAAGRMRELVSAFALDSQALLRANEAGGQTDPSKRSKRDPSKVEGKADIWQVSWRDEDDVVPAISSV